VWLGVVAAVGGLALVLGLAERGEGAPLAVVFVAVFGLSIAAATGTPVQQAIVANLVPTAVFGSAVGLLWASYALGGVIGPLAAVPVKNVGGTAAVCAFQAVTAFIAALCILSLRQFLIPTRAAPERESNRNASLREALAYAVKQPLVLPVVAVTAVTAFFGASYGALLAIFAFSILGLPFEGYTSFLVVISLGSILGGLATSFSGRRGGPRTAAAQMASLGLVLGLFAIARDARLFILLIALAAFLSVWLLTSLEVVLQYTIDDAHRGRVMAAYMVVRLGLIPFGALALGALAEVKGAQGAVLTYAAVMLVSAGVFGIWALREHRGRVVDSVATEQARQRYPSDL
jgi:predicted MFS family arabinose efflux permease